MYPQCFLVSSPPFRVDTAVSRSESSVSVTSTCTADPDPARQATTRTTVSACLQKCPPGLRLLRFPPPRSHHPSMLGSASMLLRAGQTVRLRGRSSLWAGVRLSSLFAPMSVFPTIVIIHYSSNPVSSFPFADSLSQLEFFSLGIPGPYKRPPIGEADETPSLWYVVTKGLYVGIFTSW